MADPLYSSLKTVNSTSKVTPESLVFQTKILTPEEAKNVINEKIAFKPLLLVPSLNLEKQGDRKESVASKKRKKLSSKEKKKLQLNVVPKIADYSQFKHLHSMWCSYILEVIAGCTGESLMAKLAKAEYQGAYMQVLRSKSTTRVGLEGICIHESKHMLSLITKENRVVRKYHFQNIVF